MKRDYKHDYTAEIMVQMKDGTEYHIFGTPIKTEDRYEATIFTLWNYQEFQRMTIEEKISKPIAFYMPDCDLKATMEYGYLCIRKGKELLLMEDRNKIKKIMSGVDSLIDFNDV